MKVQMRTTACGPVQHHYAGQVYDLPDPVAQAYLEGGYAVAVPSVVVRAEAEFATLPVEETADARPRGRRK